jgi:hypothetical protein
LQTRYDSVVDETILQSAPTSAFPYIGELVIYLRQVDRECKCLPSKSITK